MENKEALAIFRRPAQDIIAKAEAAQTEAQAARVVCSILDTLAGVDDATAEANKRKAAAEAAADQAETSLVQVRQELASRANELTDLDARIGQRQGELDSLDSQLIAARNVIAEAEAKGKILSQLVAAGGTN
jgi:DNA repair exonuclease SbcCD ATPase subunit